MIIFNNDNFDYEKNEESDKHFSKILFFAFSLDLQNKVEKRGLLLPNGSLLNKD
jgi:hypothetical protein